MTANLVLAIAGLCIALILGLQQFKSNKEIKESIRRGRVAVAVEDAKAEHRSEAELRAPIAYYASVKDLDDALANYSTIIARPVFQFSQLDPDSKEVETWYRFEILDFLSEPKSPACKECLFAKNIPQQIGPIQPDEIVLVKNTGTVLSEGIKVSASDPAFPDFKLHQRYLLFLMIDQHNRFGRLDLGPDGVSQIEDDNNLTALVAKGAKLNSELRARYGTIDQIRTNLKFRRFPELVPSFRRSRQGVFRMR